MTTVTTEAPQAAEAAPIEGTVAVRPAAAAARTQRETAEPIDGAILWLFVRRYLSTYVSFRTQAELDLVTAWVFHACSRNRMPSTGMGPLIWNATPRLLVLSRSRGAGKSTVLTLVSILTGSLSGKTARITPAALAQSIAQAHETVCIDEGRLVFGAGAAHQDLQACLIDGYTPGSTYRVSKTRLSVFGAVAIASKESLITEATKAVDGDESSIGDLLDRCVKITVEAPPLPMPEVGKRAREHGALLARALVMWTDNMRDRLIQAAEQVADEDYDDAHERAKNGQAVKENLRLLQIGRPLRAVGRVIDGQIRDSDENADPQCEADILAALGERAGGDPGIEAAQIMAELGQLSQEWADGNVDEPADPWEDERAAAAEYRAGYAETWPGEDTELHDLPGPWPDLETAQAVCEAIERQPLEWQPSPRRAGTWGASIQRPGGPQIDYAITEATGK